MRHGVVLNSARSAVFASALLASARLHADPLGMYGMGSRSSAMGSAVVAEVEDSSANYYNPAGLVHGHALRLDVGYVYASHQLSTNGHDNHVDPVHGITAGVVAPGTVFHLPFAFGFGLHLPDDRLSRSRSLPQAQPRWELYDNREQMLFIAANLAIAPTPWLRLGGGLGFVSSTQGSLDIYGEVAYPNADNSQLHHAVEADLTAVRYPLGGLQIDVLPTLTLGAAYRGQYRVALALDATVNGSVVVGNPSNPAATRVPGIYGLSSTSVAVFSPQQAVLGGSWRPVRNLTIVLDLTWVNWSAYINPTATLGTSLSLMIPPTLAGFNVPVLPPSQTVLPAAFHDTFVPRVGVEWRRPLANIHELALRAGYRYDATPVPAQTGATNFLDSTRHVVSLGAGVALRGLAPVIAGSLHIDVHGELQVLEPRTVQKLDPTDPVGDYALGGWVVTFGSTVGVVF